MSQPNASSFHSAPDNGRPPKAALAMPDAAPQLSSPSPAPQLLSVRTGSVLDIAASGSWQMHTFSKADEAMLEKAEKEAAAELQSGNVTRLCLRTEALADWDSSLLATFAFFLRLCAAHKISADTSELPQQLSALLGGDVRVAEKKTARHKGFLESLGCKASAIPRIALDAITFVGEVTQSFGRLFAGRNACSPRDVWNEIRQCGIDALAIVSITSLLLGLIVAFVSGYQLSTLGAEVYMASLVTISMVRVLGPILTGIVMAGRTGASYAAIIGSMQVNEEVDALSAFGISPVDFLVLPRVLALAVMMPFLTIYADFMGILGGFLVGTMGMNVPPAVFIANIVSYTSMTSVWIGLLHAFVFGFVVSLCGTYQGIRCGRSAEAVGKATTASVVYSIIGIIVSTSILTIIFTVVPL